MDFLLNFWSFFIQIAHSLSNEALPDNLTVALIESTYGVEDLFHAFYGEFLQLCDLLIEPSCFLEALDILDLPHPIL
jgi:hypothetical protein